MKAKHTLTLIFCSLLLSSCGLIEKFKSSFSSSPSTDKVAETPKAPSDDLFSTSNNINSESPSFDSLADIKPDESAATATTTEAAPIIEAKTDGPQNIDRQTATASEAPKTNELETMKEEFTAKGPNETQIAIKKEIAPVPMVMPKDVPVNQNMKVSNEIKTYNIQKGETLMQIAFKLYGDISKWKDLKKLNENKVAGNGQLKSHSTLKYYAPETPFTWNPEGTPYMIKKGETLGTISNSVYKTPKKWKYLWENNRPLIKNPNIIFAGFTLFYKNDSMADYVHPIKTPEVEKNVIPLKEMKKIDLSVQKVDEEIKVEKALTAIERLDQAVDDVKDIRASTQRTTLQESPEDDGGTSGKSETESNEND